MNRPLGDEAEIVVPIAGGQLAATVTWPHEPRGVVVFAHGSGSSRHSPRNQLVADALDDAGYATILLDLLTETEDEIDRHTSKLRFDIRLLAERVIQVIDWLDTRPEARDLPLGLFGASTGAAAALVAAAQRPTNVRALVSRGGRPDLAGPALPQVKTPTLLIVGGDDGVVVEMNRQAAQTLAEHAQLVIIPGAGHLFAEPGTLEAVAQHATDWFDIHLRMLSQ